MNHYSIYLMYSSHTEALPFLMMRFFLNEAVRNVDKVRYTVCGLLTNLQLPLVNIYGESLKSGSHKVY